MMDKAWNDPARAKVVATGGILSTLAAATCCVLPLALAAAGVGGAWIGGLTMLAPLQPVFLAVAVACIGAGLWMVYARRHPACEGQSCGTPISLKGTKAALWLSSALMAIVLMAG